MLVLHALFVAAARPTGLDLKLCVLPAREVFVPQLHHCEVAEKEAIKCDEISSES